MNFNDLVFSINNSNERKKDLGIFGLFLILMGLVLIYFFVPGKPIIEKVDSDIWYKSKVIKIEKDSKFYNGVNYYIYCVNDKNSIHSCKWKKTKSKNVNVGNNGINYVWFKAVAFNKRISLPSKKVIVKIDNEGPEKVDVDTVSTNNSIKVDVKAFDKISGIKSYFYKIDDKDYVESKEPSYIFNDLKSGTSYNINVIISDMADNKKEISFTVKTGEDKKEIVNNFERNNDNNFSSNEIVNNAIVNNKDNDDKIIIVDGGEKVSNPKDSPVIIDDDNPNTNPDDNNNDEEEKQFIPLISLSGVPSVFTVGESYDLPTSYKFGPEGGRVYCLVDNEDLLTNTASIGFGKHTIVCSAVSNNGIATTVSKDITVENEDLSNEVWDGFIKLNLYYPTGSIDRQWRLGKEDVTRVNGWTDYTGPITIKLSDIENVYIRYRFKDDDIDDYKVIAPNGRLVVDIVPSKYELKEGETTNVIINYSSNADKCEYKINDGDWTLYSNSFSVPMNTKIEARVTKTYDNGIKKINFDSVYISESGLTDIISEPVLPGNEAVVTMEDNSISNYVKPSYLIDGPTINLNTSDFSLSVIATIIAPEDARDIYYKIDEGNWKKYNEPIDITSNCTIYAKYVNNDGVTSLISSKYVGNVKNEDETFPSVSINVNMSDNNKGASVSLNAINYDTLEYSLDGHIYSNYDGIFVVNENTTIYAKATNQHGSVIETRAITDLGETPSVVNDVYDINISLSSEDDTTGGLLNSSVVTIDYDEDCVDNYYKIGDSDYSLYEGSFNIDSNSTIYAYCNGTGGNGYNLKSEDKLLSGISSPIINLSTTEPATSVVVTIDYPENAEIMRYKIGNGNWIDYTGSFVVSENTTIYAYAKSALGDEANSSLRITNIIDIPRYVTYDMGDYYIIRLNYPDNSLESSREYKWTNNGKWKKYDKDKGILIIKESNSDILSDKNLSVTIKDEFGNNITYDDHYYFVDDITDNLMENLFMRWDYVTPDSPVIRINPTDPAKEVDVSIAYDQYSYVKQYKIMYPDGSNSGWLEYKGSFKVKKNNTVIYARGISDIEAVGKTASKKITNIDEIAPAIKLYGNFTNPVSKIYASINGRDDLGIDYVGYYVGKYDGDDILSDGEKLKNNQSFIITDNGIYTVFAVDLVGNLTVQELDVTNIDKESPKVEINLLTDTYGSSVDVSIDYSDSTIKEYKIGTNNNYVKYKDKFTINSLDVYKYANEDGSITLYARGTDSVGNVTTVSEDIYLLDLDVPKVPEIIAHSGYPTLGEYGVYYDDMLVINYDRRDDIVNYYSYDNKNWNVYNGILHVKSGTIYAKSVKKESGLTVATSSSVVSPTDAIGVNAYDRNNNTYFSLNSGFMYVDSSAWNKNVFIYTPNYTYTINFYDEEENNLFSQRFANGGKNGDSILIPENSYKMTLNFTFSSKLYEVDIDNSPVINHDEIYPTLTEYGVENAYSKINIDYFSTSVRREYKINDGEWQNYNGEFNVNIGDIVTARGYDKDNNVSRESSYTSAISDMVGPLAYDGSIDTSISCSSNYKHYYLFIDSSVWNKNAFIYVRGTSVTLNFYDINGNSIYKKSYGWNSTSSYDIVKIPENAVKLSFDDYYTFNIYEIQLEGVNNGTKSSTRSTVTKSKISFVDSPYISVDNADYTANKVVSINYPDGDYVNEYSFDAKNWYKYEGSINIDKPVTIYARSLSGDEVVSSSSHKITKIDNVVPSISLDNVPDEINLGDSYDLPSSYSYNDSKVKGSYICIVDFIDNISNTNQLSVGKHNIKCSITSGTGITSDVSKDIVVKEIVDEKKDNDVEEDTSDVSSDEEINNDEVVSNEENE